MADTINRSIIFDTLDGYLRATIIRCGSANLDNNLLAINDLQAEYSLTKEKAMEMEHQWTLETRAYYALAPGQSLILERGWRKHNS